MRHPVDRYVDRLLRRRRRPKPFAPTEDDLAVLRTAIDLMAAAPDAHDPRPAFVSQLRTRLDEREQAVQLNEAVRPQWRVPARRRFLAAGALTATGAAAGAAGALAFAGGAATSAAAGQTGTGGQQGSQDEIDPINGAWHDVAASADLSEGAVLSFNAGAVGGFLRRVSGRVQAVSDMCTHQGCRLDLAAARDRLTCPCHGAAFTLAGANLTHPRQVGRPLPALPRLPVREQNGRIEIYGPAQS